MHDGAANRSVDVRSKLAGPPDLWEMKRAFQIHFLKQVGLLPHHRLLDLGCGPLRGGTPLIEYLEAGMYTGVDVRREALEEGRRELTKSGLSTRQPALVHCKRLRELNLEQKFDHVWAFAVLIHLEDRILDDAIAAVSRHLAPDGVFHASVNVGSHPDGEWQGFPVVYRSAAFYSSTFERHCLEVADIGCLRDYGHEHPRLPADQQKNQRMLRAVRAQ